MRQSTGSILLAVLALVVVLAAPPPDARAEDPGGDVEALAATRAGSVGAAEEADGQEKPASPEAHVLPAGQRWAAGRDLFHAGRLSLAIPILRALSAADDITPDQRRDATHLLAWAELEAGREGAAAEAFATALALGTSRDARTVLEDRMRLGYGRALGQLGKIDEALSQLRRVEREASSPHRAEAVLLQARLYEEAGDARRALREYDSYLERWPAMPGFRDAAVRAALLEVSLGRQQSAAERLRAVLTEAPDSRAGATARDTWRALIAAGVTGALPDLGVTDDLRIAEHLLRERFFDEAGAVLDRYIARAGPKGRAADLRPARALQLWHQRETMQWKQALETHAWLEANGGDGMSWHELSRAHAYAGDMAGAEAVILGRYNRRKSRAYWDTLAELRYEFGDYGGAYDAYDRSRRHVRAASRMTDRMVWCLLRMGEAGKAARLWEAAGSSRSKRQLWVRYWYGRALSLSGDEARAREVFGWLVEDVPFDYYGVQARSRLLELDGEAPAVSGSTIYWSEEAASGAFAEAPRRADQATIEATLAAFANEHGDAASEAHRAAELARLGFLDEAAGELRVIDMDLRALRYGASLSSRARADMLDNRRVKLARGGATLHESGRKSLAATRDFRRNAGAIRDGLRLAQRALAEPYGLRRDAYESGRMARAEDVQGDAWRDAYPIAWPELVSAFARQFEVPVYYVYAIMTVESAFHPHAVSVSNAFGLLQMIPKTGRHVADELGFVDFTPEVLLEPQVNVYFGTYYLSAALKKFRGQEPLAAAAYNAGPHRVAAWLAARGEGPLDMFIEQIPFDQARNYTKSVIKYVARYRATYHRDDLMYVSNRIERDFLAKPNY